MGRRAEGQARMVQACAVPLRDGPDGGEVLLISSRYAGDWVLPKGFVEPGEAPEDAAAREAVEEAGVVGVVGDHLGSFPFQRGGQDAVMEAFVLHVTEQLERWEEMLQRRQLWVALGKAVAHVSRPELVAILNAARTRPARSQPKPPDNVQPETH